MENIQTIAAKYLTRVIEAWEQFSQPVETEIPGRARKDRPRLPIVKVSIIFFSCKGYKTIKNQAIVSHDVFKFNILQNSQNCKMQMEFFRGLNVKEQKSIASIDWEKMTNEMRRIL